MMREKSQRAADGAVFPAESVVSDAISKNSEILICNRRAIVMVAGGALLDNYWWLLAVVMVIMMLKLNVLYW